MSENRIVWLGHSTVLVELDGVRVVTDPVLRERVMHLRRRRAADTAVLRELDAILISHVHYDHLDMPSLALLDRSLPVVLPRRAGGLLRRRGFGDVREVEAGDEIALGRVRVRAVHAEHARSRRPGTRPTSSLGYVIEGTQSVYFAGDTDLFDAMAAIGPVDVALLPVAGWGPRLPAGHLDPSRAAEAAALLRARAAVPVHWGTYAPWRATDERDDAPALAFAEALKRVAPDTEIRVLQPGEAYPLEPGRPPARAT